MRNAPWAESKEHRLARPSWVDRYMFELFTVGPGMRLEILVASLKPGYRDEDLAVVMRWNTDYHEKRGAGGIHYYVSEDRTTFVMTVPHQEAVSDGIAKEWKESGAEQQTWFREMMDKVFTGAGGRMYHEVQP